MATTNDNGTTKRLSIRRWYRHWLLLLAIAVLAVFFLLPDLIGRYMNGIYSSSSDPVGEAAQTLHERLLIADLHADTLLWNRDPLQRGRYGHLDLPRLLEARMGVQIFSAVTKTPRGLNFERNDATTDNITALVIAQRWPPRTWTSLTERALYQASRLRRLADRSDGRFIVLYTRADLLGYLALRKTGETLTAGMLAIEGMHALDGDPNNLHRLHAAGFRMMGLTHFFDNEIGGSAHGLTQGGLTLFGTNMLREMEQLGIIIDLAHGSAQLITDVLKAAKRPVVVSHTGVKGTCPRTRNLSDEQLHSIAKNGGLVGIAFFEEATCGTDARSITRAIQYAVRLIGIKHVALGSDFDGAVTTPFDVTGLPTLTASLVEAGFSPSDIEAIMGGNLLRLLTNALPLER
jgi:membrane dipeptidase